MNKFEKFKRYINNPLLFFSLMARKSGGFKQLDDKTYLGLLYRSIYGKKLNWDNPTLFSEKLQWLKLYDRKLVYSDMVDKCNAKEYVVGIIGKQYIIPTLGVWESFDDINFNLLPKDYVLKCTHDCGGLVICRNNDIDYDSARKKIQKSLKTNYYWLFREWPYKNVKPRIIAEQYMENHGEGLTDYKFYCFNGEPKFLYISKGLENHDTAKISFLNVDWSFAPYHRIDYKEFEELPHKPKEYSKMLELCRKLSSGFMFLRVDLYEINGQIYFSEFTFSPNSGFMIFKDANTDHEIGDMIKLNL